MTETVALTVFSVILWAATHSNSPITDTATLYSLRYDTPKFEAFKEASDNGVGKVTAPTISLATWYGINSTCMNPDALQTLALAEPSFMSSTNFPVVPTSPANIAILPKLLYFPNLLTSPLCRCLVATLDRYNTLNPTGIATAAPAKKADEAYKSCYSTNGHTPQQRQWYESNYNPEKVFTRRNVSKVSFALIICLSFVFNFIYGSLDFNTETFYSSWQNITKLSSLFVISLIQLIIPILFSDVAHGSSVIAFMCIVILPAVVLQFFLMEIAWAYLNTQNRAIHIHPYAFSTTLISLNAIALLEGGVFDFQTHIYYMCISHVLSVAYAATLFFTHFQKHESVDVHSLTGYIVLLATATFLVISLDTPSHPTNGAQNLINLLPWIFTICVFGFSIFIENTLRKVQDENVITSKTASLYYEGYASLVLFVLGFYTLKLWHVSFGDTILSNAGDVIFRNNYALLFDMNPNIPNLYSIP